MSVFVILSFWKFFFCLGDNFLCLGNNFLCLGDKLEEFSAFSNLIAHLESSGQGPPFPARLLDEFMQGVHKNEKDQNRDGSPGKALIRRKIVTLAFICETASQSKQITGVNTSSHCRACQSTEVDLIADELVIVLEKSGEGWWYVKAQSGLGWAPNHFLKVPTSLMDENPQVSCNCAVVVEAFSLLASGYQQATNTNKISEKPVCVCSNCMLTL